MYNRNRKKNDPKSVIISIVIALLFLLPGQVTGMLLAFALFAAPFGIAFWMALKKKKNQPRSRDRAQTFDDCPKPVCFHKDKGEHHVKKGREIDPWDRPDIDISKYQRR